MTGDEGAAVRVAGPGAYVDDVEGVVEKGEEGGELGEGEGSLEVEGICGEGAGWGEGGEAEVDVL